MLLFIVFYHKLCSFGGRGIVLFPADNNSDLKNCNLINCTPIGLSENTNIDILSDVPKIHYRAIIDINYHITTHHLNFASDKIIDGKSMFIFQALKSLDIWFESNISNKLDYKHLEQLLC